MFARRWRTASAKWSRTETVSAHADELASTGSQVFARNGNTYWRESLGWLRSVGFGLRLAPTRGAKKVFYFDVSFPLDGDSSIDSVEISVGRKNGF